MNSFLLYNKAKVLIIYAEKYILSNIPKNYIVYRKNMEQAIVNLNIDIIKANNNEGNIRRKWILPGTGDQGCPREGSGGSSGVAWRIGISERERKRFQEG